MSNTPDDATIARILCCGSEPDCDYEDAECPGRTTFGRQRLYALRSAGFDIVTTAEAVAIRATAGHAIERDATAEQLHKIADRLVDVLRSAVEMRAAQRRYFGDRSRENLIASKQAETVFDQAAAAIIRDAETGGFGHEGAGQGTDA